MSEIKDKPASSKHHNNFKGGLLEHLENTLHFAKKHFPEEPELHFLALIHDIGKAREYCYDKEEIIRTYPPVDHIIQTINMLNEFGLNLTKEELNSIQMHHGGWSPFSKSDLCELAIKLHFCDMMAVDSETFKKWGLDKKSGVES